MAMKQAIRFERYHIELQRFLRDNGKYHLYLQFLDYLDDEGWAMPLGIDDFSDEVSFPDKSPFTPK